MMTEDAETARSKKKSSHWQQAIAVGAYTPPPPSPPWEVSIHKQEMFEPITAPRFTTPPTGPVPSKKPPVPSPVIPRFTNAENKAKMSADAAQSWDSAFQV
eukprot:gene25900-11575_t